MINTLLEQRETEGCPIRVGIIGAGKFGGALAVQISQMKGMIAGVIADLNIEAAKKAYTNCGVSEDEIRNAVTREELEDAICRGKPAVCQDAQLLINAGAIDVIVECTGVPDVGAQFAYKAIQARKHVVMVNVEADVTVGAILRREADAAGVVYTLVEGDQPGSTMNIVNWARALGFEIVAAGRGTVFYGDDRQGTPDTVPQRFGFTDEQLERRHINVKMFNSFRDGSKAQLEMTALANAAGLVPDIRGMHEPSVNLEDIPKTCSLKEEGGLLSRHGVVELANSIAEDGRTMLPNPLKMGVFAVIRAEHQFQQEDFLDYYVNVGGNGKNFLLYRPYHLVAIPAPMSVAMACLFNKPTGSAQPTPTAEVVAVAKRDLKKGEVIDGSGGYLVNGLCEKAVIAREENLLPLGMCDGAVLKANVSQGAAITYEMVDLKKDTFIYALRTLQDSVCW